MKNINWPLFHKQKEFLLNLANTASFPIEHDRELMDGVIHLMDAVQDEFEGQLIDRVLDQIKNDVKVNDMTAIEQLLLRVVRCSTADLGSYLSETSEEAP